MADIALTAVQVAPVFPQMAEIYDVILAETVTKGQILYGLATDTYGIADANAAGKQQARGVALEGGGAGQSVSMLKRGHCYGFTVASLDSQSILYLSDTAGALADAAGTLEVRCGRVVPLTDATPTLVIYFDFDWRSDFS